MYRLLTLTRFLSLSQDDTAFEKQSALFALAISDIVLINMYVTFSSNRRESVGFFLPFFSPKKLKCFLV